MSANWSFFSIKYIFINSVKRSRHNVWTLCINLIEFQLFLRLFWATKNNEQKRDSIWITWDWSLVVYNLVCTCLNWLELFSDLLISYTQSVDHSRMSIEIFEIEIGIACYGLRIRGNFNIQLLQATKYGEKSKCFIIQYDIREKHSVHLNANI